MTQRRCLGCRAIISRGSRCGACRAAQKAVYHTPEYEANRLAVLERDHYECQLRRRGCRGRATTVDHIFPASRGGSSRMDNLQAACSWCNSGKRDR